MAQFYDLNPCSAILSINQETSLDERRRQEVEDPIRPPLAKRTRADPGGLVSL